MGPCRLPCLDRELGLKPRREVLSHAAAAAAASAAFTSPLEGSAERSQGRTKTEDKEFQTASVPFALAFAPPQVSSSGFELLAVAHEDGTVTLLRVNEGHVRRKCVELSSSWRAHNNAIFGLTWMQGGNKILTSSADKSVILWDVETRQALATFSGHKGSVKCTAVTATGDLVASASRDASVLLWDARSAGHNTPGQAGLCVGTIVNPHPSVLGPLAAPAQKRKLPRQARVLSPLSDHTTAHNRQPTAAASPMHGRGESSGTGRRKGTPGLGQVTSVLFPNNLPLLATAGASSGEIKLWDQRCLRMPMGVLGPAQGKSIPGEQQEPGFLRRGITSLSQDSSGTLLLSSHTDHRLRVFNVLRPEQGPLCTLDGHRVASFFTKAQLSADAKTAISGSTGGTVFTWQALPSAPFFTTPRKLNLHGTNAEITCVDLCPGNPWLVASCGDDLKVVLGSLASALSSEESLHASTDLSRRRVYA